MQEDSICGQSSDLTSSDESFCLQVKMQCTEAKSKFPTLHHLTTNLAYRLMPYHKGNHYLRARLDTCADVNIMPAGVYNLVFQDPDSKKLAPSKLEIGMYTNDRVKLVGSCVFYLVHPDTKYLQEVTFYVASNNSSVFLSCVTCLHLAWYSLTLDWTIFLLELALLPVILTTQEDQAPYLYTCIQKRIWSIYSVQLQMYGTQAYYKQGTDSCNLFRGGWWFSMLYWFPIPYSSWS